MYLTQSLHRAVQLFPDRPLTVFGDRVRTARETVDRVARLAGSLKGLGIFPGDRVGILALNSDRYHEYFYAMWWAGAAVNPLNIRWTPREIDYALRDSDTRVLFVDDAFARFVPELTSLRTVVHCGEGPTPEGMLSFEELIRSNEPIEDPRHGGDTLAGVNYTGGTTGFPKGVRMTHRSLMTSSMGTQLTARVAQPDGNNLVVMPLFHLGGISAWNAQNLVGGTQIFLPTFDPGVILASLEKHRIDSTVLVPTMIQMLCDHPDAATADVSSVKAVGYGASSITQSVLDRAMKLFPGAGFSQAYGLTEAGVVTCLDQADHREGGHRLRSAGRASSHADIRIADPDGAEVPRGSMGEIIIRSESVSPGYWNRPAENAATFRDGWMHTGDAAFMDEAGYIFIVDRLKDMIVSGGENVYSAEVENALAAHPDVAACAVIGVPDAEWGERVHAVVVARPGTEPGADELRDHVKTLIAGYKAPRTVEYTTELPLSAAGKVLKRELRARHQN